MVYKHAYLNTLPLLHSAFMLSVLKMQLKGDVGGHALNILKLTSNAKSNRSFNITYIVSSVVTQFYQN